MGDNKKSTQRRFDAYLAQGEDLMELRSFERDCELFDGVSKEASVTQGHAFVFSSAHPDTIEHYVISEALSKSIKTEQEPATSSSENTSQKEIDSAFDLHSVLFVDSDWRAAGQTSLPTHFPISARGRTYSATHRAQSSRMTSDEASLKRAIQYFEMAILRMTMELSHTGHRSPFRESLDKINSGFKSQNLEDRIEKVDNSTTRESLFKAFGL